MPRPTVPRINTDSHEMSPRHSAQGTTAGRAGRYLVEKVRCKLCALEQDVGASCAGCEAVFAEHFCAPCKLYSSVRFSIDYHSRLHAR